jgi:hypothetical protein
MLEGVSVYLIVAVLAVVAAFGFAVAAVVTVLRNNKEGRVERQLLARMPPTTPATFHYDESGALISVRTGLAESLDNQLPT